MATSPALPSLLLADDNVAAARLLEAIFGESYLLSTVHTAKETLALLRNVLFDVAIMDLNFPDMRTEELALEISKIPIRSKVIVLTVWDREDIEEELRLIAPVAVLRKPATVEQITETLAGVLGHGER